MRSSYLWAGLIAVVIGGWFASGNLEALGIKKQGDGPQKQKPVAAVAKIPQKPFTVEVQTFKSGMRQNALFIRGRTQSKKEVSVLARTNGIIEKSPFEAGDKVKAGDLLCLLDMRDRKARLAQAKAQLVSSKRDFLATSALLSKRYASKSKFAAQQALFDAASAGVEQIELDISYTQIKAPISGIITQVQGKEGGFLQPGKACATIATFDPLLVIAQVAERDIDKVVFGQKAFAQLVTGVKVSGNVTYIAQNAEISTRTFKVEITVENPGSKLRAGITSDVVIPLKPVKAHLIPAGIIGLNDQGEIGVRTIVDGDKVKFVTIKLLAQTRQGTWVNGLPDTAHIITAGQDYVLDGQTVTVSVAKGPSS